MSKKNSLKFRANNSIGKNQNKGWIVKVTIFSLITSAVLYYLSQEILINSGYFISILVLITFVLIGIIFDMIGISVTAAEEAPFHAMASRKNNAGKKAIRLIRNANKVSSFCNDVVGDICSVLSGTAVTLIILNLSKSNSALNTALAGIILSSLVSALTIGGKALGKTSALRNSNLIVYKVSVILNIFSKRPKKD